MWNTSYLSSYSGELSTTYSLKQIRIFLCMTFNLQGFTNRNSYVNFEIQRYTNSFESIKN